MTVHSLEALAAESIADVIDSARAHPELSALAERMLRRYSADSVVVGLRETAGELGVSLPTVRDWIARGVLEEIPGRRRGVSAVSLARVLAAKLRVQALSKDPRPLAGILDALEDDDLLALARTVAQSSDETAFIRYSDEDLAQLETL